MPGLTCGEQRGGGGLRQLNSARRVRWKTAIAPEVFWWLNVFINTICAMWEAGTRIVAFRCIFPISGR